MNIYDHIHKTIVWLLLIFSGTILGQIGADYSSLKVIADEVVIRSPKEQVWMTLEQFGTIGTFHGSIEESYPINGSESLSYFGAEREILVPDGVNNIILKEKIIDFKKGAFLMYKVNEWENIALRTMYVTLGLKVNTKGETILYREVKYKMHSKLRTRMMKNKMQRDNFDRLLGFKYFIESGERNIEPKVLRDRYKLEGNEPVDDDLVVVK